MTEKQALRVAAKKFGTKALVRSSARRRGLSSAERRQTAEAALREHMKEEPKILPIEQWDASATIGEYVAARSAFNAAIRAWRKRRDELLGEARYYAYDVGQNLGWAFEIKGSGDSWEDALSKAGCQ